jgi:Uncharacterized ABC-type transport system, permease components
LTRLHRSDRPPLALPGIAARQHIKATPMPQGTDPDHPVRDIVDRLTQAADKPRVTLGDIVHAFGETAFLPVMMVPALIVFSPLSGIPLLPTLCGLMIVLIALQLAVGRRHLWLPQVVMQRSMDGARLRAVARRLTRLADWLDNRSRRRLRLVFFGPFRAGIYGLCALCGAAMPFLEIVPFSSSILALAVLLFCTAVLARDGVLAVIGVGVIALAAAVPLAVYGLFTTA